MDEPQSLPLHSPVASKRQAIEWGIVNQVVIWEHASSQVSRSQFALKFPFSSNYMRETNMRLFLCYYIEQHAVKS